VNVAGVAVDEAPRGICLVRPDDDVPVVHRVRCRVRWDPGRESPLRTRRRLQLLLGTAQVGARCLMPTGRSIAPGEEGELELQLRGPIAAMPGDRFVLRDERPTTVAAGEVVSGAVERAPKPPRAAAPRGRVRQPARLRRALRRRLGEAGLAGASVATAAADVGEPPHAVARALDDLAHDREAVEIAPGRWVDAVTLEAAVGAAAARMADAGATLADLRALWGVGREQAIRIAEHMDACGLTVRRGAERRLADRPFARDV
jgi:selenocysteine-specific elongation factor